MQTTMELLDAALQKKNSTEWVITHAVFLRIVFAVVVTIFYSHKPLLREIIGQSAFGGCFQDTERRPDLCQKRATRARSM